MTRNINLPLAKKMGQYIKEARSHNKLTQEELAESVGISDRAIRDWEAGKAIPHKKNKIKLSEKLDIPIQMLDLPTQNGYSLKQVEEQTSRLKILLDKGNFTLVLAICEMLKPHVEQYTGNELGRLEQLTLLEYFMGHTISITRDGPAQAAECFKRMTKYAHDLKNVNSEVLGRTYQAEMHRRMKDPVQALHIIERTPIDARVDKWIRGNFFQLSGRLYTSMKEPKKAERAFLHAEEMAGSTARRTSDIYVCFNQCSVYEERAKTCLLLDKPAFDQGIEYIELAEKNIPEQEPRWWIAIRMTKGELYIHEAHQSPTGVVNKANLATGKKLIADGFRLAHKSGHERQIARARKLSKTFAKTSIERNDTSNDLDALFDTIEREEKSNIEDFK